MAYHFQGSHLRVLQKFSQQNRNITSLRQSRGIFVLHALPTSVEFVSLLKKSGVEISNIYVKPYSIDDDSKKKLENIVTKRLIVLDYDRYEEDGIQQILSDLKAMIDLSSRDKKFIFGFDIGGYLLKPMIELLKLNELQKEYVVGIVEDTTFGHNKYTESIQALELPVMSVARSYLKEIEARFVGRDAVLACNMVLRKQGIMLSGRKALSIGYGMIGANVARELKSNDLVVSVYDKRDCRNLHAYIDGFDVNKKAVLIKNADIIFSQTASNALSFEEMEECKDGVILASVGSKNTEFDIKELKSQAIRVETYGTSIKEYHLNNSKRIRVIHDGAAVNFLNPSLPIEVFDLVFSEIFISIMLLLKRREQYESRQIHEIHENFQSEISRDWLRLVNS